MVPLATTLVWEDIPKEYNDNYNMVIVMLFAFDILMNFRTAFDYHGTIVRKPSLIGFRYVTSTFLIDLIATVPWDRLWEGVNDDLTGAYKFSRALKLVRIMRIHKLFRSIRHL